MLKVSGVGPDDVLYDLGCGDGRILVTAVKEFGVQKAVGFEIRKDVYEKAVERIKDEGLFDKITVINEDFSNADVSEATVITLYLTGTANSSLKAKLEKECHPGTRVVSRVFTIEGWTTILSDRSSDVIHVYRVPDAFRV